MVQSDSVYSGEHDRSNRGSGGDDQNTRRELKALQDKMDLLLSDRAKQEKVNLLVIRNKRKWLWLMKLMV